MPKKQDDPEELSALGSRIASARTYRELTQAQLGLRIGMDGQNLSKVETGKQATSSAAIRQICNELQVSADYIVRGVEDASLEGHLNVKLLWESAVQRLVRRQRIRSPEVLRQLRLKAAGPFETVEAVDRAVAEQLEEIAPKFVPEPIDSGLPSFWRDASISPDWIAARTRHVIVVGPIDPEIDRELARTAHKAGSGPIPDVDVAFADSIRALTKQARRSPRKR